MPATDNDRRCVVCDNALPATPGDGAGICAMCALMSAEDREEKRLRRISPGGIVALADMILSIPIKQVRFQWLIHLLTMDPTPAEIEFNLNDYVLVRLNEFGHACLREWHRVIVGDRHPYVAPVEDSDGWSRHQLWHLMERLGQYLHLGCKLPFAAEMRLACAGRIDGAAGAGSQSEATNAPAAKDGLQPGTVAIDERSRPISDAHPRVADGASVDSPPALLSAAEAYNTLRKVAAEALEEWDKDNDHRVGKMLKAIAGESKGYRADIDQMHVAFAAADRPADPVAVLNIIASATPGEIDRLRDRVATLESYLEKSADDVLLVECEKLYCPKCASEVRLGVSVCMCDQCVNPDGSFPYEPPLPLSYGSCYSSREAAMAAIAEAKKK